MSPLNVAVAHDAQLTINILPQTRGIHVTHVVPRLLVHDHSLARCIQSLHQQHTPIMSVAGPSTKPVVVTYCSVCSLPTEYCEFGASFSKCKTTLEANDKEEFDRLWGEGMCS